MDFKLILSSKCIELYDYTDEPKMELNIQYLFECIKLTKTIHSINTLFKLIQKFNNITTPKYDNVIYDEIQLELIENMSNNTAYDAIVERLKLMIIFEIEDLNCTAKKEISNIFQGDVVTLLNQEQIYEITCLFQTFKMKLGIHPELDHEIDLVNKMMKRMTSLDITLIESIEIREDKFVRLQKNILKLGNNLQNTEDEELITAFINIFNYFDKLKGDYDFGMIKHDHRTVFMKLSTEKVDDMLVLNIDSILFEKNIKGTFMISYDAYMFILNKYYFESLKLPEQTKKLICEKYGFSKATNSNMWKSLNMFIIFYINLIVFLDLNGGTDVSLDNQSQNHKYLTKKRISKISMKIKNIDFPEVIKQILYLAINEYWF